MWCSHECVHIKDFTTALKVSQLIRFWKQNYTFYILFCLGAPLVLPDPPGFHDFHRFGPWCIMRNHHNTHYSAKSLSDSHSANMSTAKRPQGAISSKKSAVKSSVFGCNHHSVKSCTDWYFTHSRVLRCITEVMVIQTQQKRERKRWCYSWWVFFLHQSKQTKIHIYSFIYLIIYWNSGRATLARLCQPVLHIINNSHIKNNTDFPMEYRWNNLLQTLAHFV